MKPNMATLKSNLMQAVRYTVRAAAGMSLFSQNLGIKPSKSAEVESRGAMSENSINNNNYEYNTVNESETRSSDPGEEGHIGFVSTYKDNFDVYFVVDQANYIDEVLRSYSQRRLLL